MLSKVFIIASILLTQINLLAQQAVNTRNENRATAAHELESIIIEAKNLDNKNAIVNIRSRTAMLLSFSDPARSEAMFLEIWKLRMNKRKGLR